MGGRLGLLSLPIYSLGKPAMRRLHTRGTRVARGSTRYPNIAQLADDYPEGADSFPGPGARRIQGPKVKKGPELRSGRIRGGAVLVPEGNQSSCRRCVDVPMCIINGLATTRGCPSRTVNCVLQLLVMILFPPLSSSVVRMCQKVESGLRNC